MKGVYVAFLVAFLYGCGEDHPSPETTSGATETTTTAPTTPAAPDTTTSSATAQATSQDPWSAIPAAVAALGDGAIADQVRKSLETRAEQRSIDDSKVRRAQMNAVSQLATSCSASTLSQSFADLQAAESASLAADRAVLREILTTVGAEGRTLLWESVAPSGIYSTSRKRMAKDLTSTLPATNLSQEDSSEEEVLETRRILLGLGFTVEAVELDTSAALSQFSVDIQDMDPASDETPAAIEAGLQKIDDALIAAQKTKFDKLLVSCDSLPAEHWLAFLENGTIKTYIGRLGGNSGIVTSVGGSGPRGGPGSTGQQGGMAQGGQMMGGQQGGQMMGGQQGGMMGGQQSGQQGGMMGGQQSGQQGGMMGGQQGGMMGGQQGGMMGGQQSGQQGGMMGGQQGGQQGGMMGGQQGGMMGGQQGGQQGGMMGGQQGGQQGGMMGGQQGGQQGGMMGGQQGGQMMGSGS